MLSFFRLPTKTSRWQATRIGARLGIVAATLTGVALALHLGGRDGYAVPMAYILGMPLNLILTGVIWAFRWTGDIISSAGPASEWSIRHLLVCGSVALNWTAVGFATDLIRRRTTPPTGGQEEQPREFPLPDPLRDAFDELERKVRAREGNGPAGRLKRVA